MSRGMIHIFSLWTWRREGVMLLFSSHSSLSPPLSPSPLSPQADILRAADGRQPTQHVLVVCCISVVFYFLVACLFFSICVIACNIFFFRYIPVFISTYLFIFLFYFLFSYVKDNAYSFVQLSTSFVSPPLTAPFFPHRHLVMRRSFSRDRWWALTFERLPEPHPILSVPHELGTTSPDTRKETKSRSLRCKCALLAWLVVGLVIVGD